MRLTTAMAMPTMQMAKPVVVSGCRWMTSPAGVREKMSPANVAMAAQAGRLGWRARTAVAECAVSMR
jgi:hypothetical protein